MLAPPAVRGQGQQNHARDDEAPGRPPAPATRCGARTPEKRRAWQVLRLRNELTRCKGEVKSLKDELKQREIGSSEWRVKLRANWCERVRTVQGKVV